MKVSSQGEPLPIADSQAADATPPHSGKVPLRTRILRAGSWTIFGQGVRFVLRLGSNLIMTRLLAPEVFGIMGIAVMVQVVIANLSDIGLRPAVFQSSRGDQAEFLNTAWMMQIARGVLSWIVCLLIAGSIVLGNQLGWFPAGSVYASPDLPAVIAVTSFTAVLLAFESTKAMVAERSVDLKRLTYIDLATNFAGIALMIPIAWYTRSLWSFVIGGLLTSFLVTILTHVALPGQRNRVQWDASAAKELFTFGRWVIISSSFTVLAMNGDRILMGAWFDPTTLGLYLLALNFALMLPDITGGLFFSVAMPALSEIARERRQEFRALYLKTRLPFDVVLLTAAGALFALGQLVIDVLYDPRYSMAGVYAQQLSFVMVFARFVLANAAYLALGQPKYLTATNFARMVGVFTMVPLGYYFYGIPGAVWGYAFHMAPMLPLIYWFNKRHGLNDLRYEALVLVCWPAGFALGWAVEKAALALLAYFGA